MLIIVGLGNPGTKHAKQRHNVGFMAVDEIHRHESFSPWKARFQALVSEGRIGSVKTLLIKPTTYMNESGRAVGEAARFYKVGPDDVIVLYDELDLASGKIRIKIGGGAGGHNGIRSIDAHLGKNYKRIRIGIDHPGQKERVTSHVLGDFAKADHIWLDPMLEEIGRNADLLANGKDPDFMNRIALRIQPNKNVKTPKQKSHIHKANKNGPKPTVPTSGPMADMLKKLLGGKED